MSDWEKRTEWKKIGNNFTVVVSRHAINYPSYSSDKGPNLWAIYAYIYPDHPLFPQFVEDAGIWQPATNALNLHGSATLFWTHRADPNDHEEISSYQVGCDYNHLHDTEYTHMGDDTFEDGPIARDAQDLFDLLSDEKERAA